MKCDVSLDKLENDTQSPENPVELLKDVVRWDRKSSTIRDAIRHVRDAWKEVTESCIRSAWKKLCLYLTINFGGFDLNETL